MTSKEQSPEIVGRTIGHYRILEKLGQGGMGRVYRALDQNLKREIAVKVLPPELTSDASRMQAFKREAQAVASLNHPNIVTIYSIEEFEGHPFITMELVPGRVLSELIPYNGFPLDEFFRIALPLADGVSAAHEHGITHRDLKPANVMVSNEGPIKILDFGLARFHDLPVHADDTETPTETDLPGHTISGTVPYMSPEQIQARPHDYRSDIFSLGVILFEMATGRRPFRGASFAEMAASIQRDDPPLVVELRSELPRQLSRIIAHCLEKDTRRRLQAAADLRNELEALRKELTLGPSASRSSIAVLPFTDMSREKDQDYFCEGVAEEILNTLGKIKDLHVVSRVSSFRFKSLAVDVREIGRLLGVRNVLEGSVRKSNNQLRVSVELIDTRDGYTLWTEKYDREMKDVFEIQEDIASRVVEALRITLSPKERQALKKTPTDVLDAYDYYLRGRQFFYHYSKKGMEFALQMFTRAIELDSSYARAYAGIADCCSFLYMYGGSTATARDRAESASLRALELDPSSAEAHASRGVALSLNAATDQASGEFEKAIQLDPGLFEAYYFYARTLFAQGELEKALELYEMAGRVHPEDYQALLLMAQIYADLNQDARADSVRREGVRRAEERLKLNPDDCRALYMGANGLVALGDLERGLEWARQALVIEPDEPMVLYNVACVFSLAGRLDEAIDCLERAVAGGLHQKGWLENDSNLDPLRVQARFQALMDQL